jgi:DNA excision repair protein ERCC-2
LLAEAPTGIGKTSATLFPALKGIQTGSHQQVVYVTAKTSGRAAAEETLGQFVDQGLVVNSLSLTAKDKICFSPGQACQAEECPFAKGYYDRRRAAMTEALQRRVVHRLAIEEIARAHEVCPYQLAAELLPWVDVIIGDYHYIYGLTGLLGGPPEDSPSRAVLVDEAHNLPVRARDMYSAGLRKVDLIASRRQAQGDVKKALNRLNNWFLERNREEWESPDFRVSAELPVSLEDRLQGFTAAVAEAMGEDGTYLPSRPLLLEFFFQCLQLQRVAECFGDDFQLEYERGSGRQSLQLRLVCLDPGRLLGMRHHMMESTVLFSATLSPLHWTASALGLSEAAALCSLASPFSAEQLQVQLDTTVDTRYQQRSRSLPRLVSRIQSWLDEAQGNCLVFFPSYAYMEQFLEAAGLDRLEAGHTWIQQRHQDDGKRDELIELLRNGSNVVAFCILGGVFGEGIDLPGDALSRVVIVGVGLPQFNRNTECLRNYYQSVLGNGFEFAYLYPGMQKVNQALGRVIRKDTDVGRALLIDSRYMQSQYRALLPTHWDISNYH